VKRAARQALDALFYYHKRYGGRVFPCQAKMAARARMSPGNLRKGLLMLKQAGLLIVEKRGRHSAEYFLSKQAIADRSARSSAVGGAVKRGRSYIGSKVTTPSSGYCAHVPYKPSRETQNPIEASLADLDGLEAFIAAHEARQGAAACVSASQLPDRKPAMRQEASNHQRAQVQS
jgi:hypothetical protein